MGRAETYQTRGGFSLDFGFELGDVVLSLSVCVFSRFSCLRASWCCVGFFSECVCGLPLNLFFDIAVQSLSLSQASDKDFHGPKM